MNSLNYSNWGKFKLSELFSFENCKCSNASSLIDGDEIYYVGAKKTDNGIMHRVARDNDLVSKGNCIVFICDGQGSIGYSNYFPDDFIGSTTLTVGYNPNLNKFIGMFLVSVLDLERPKYSFGRKYRKYLENTTILLPKTKSGKPDWQRMESYTKKIFEQNNVKIITKNKESKKLPDIDRWKEFRLRDLFTFKRGKGITTAEIEENPGSIPCVQSGETDNGIIGYMNDAFLRDSKHTYIKAPFLSLARSGTSGVVLIQKKDSYIGDSVYALKLKTKESIYLYIFLSTILNKERYRYTYGHKVVIETYIDKSIKLPADKHGNPDWAYMESYIKSLPHGDNI
ncbi:MAG: restriction endonuclease subunit S [Fibromonadaceae bacterium]|jgi:restriction endonuclease S subunit|nr:restriction endonuclease subunit S [Fibromonadaceae bacterium]